MQVKLNTKSAFLLLLFYLVYSFANTFFVIIFTSGVGATTYVRNIG